MFTYWVSGKLSWEEGVLFGCWFSLRMFRVQFFYVLLFDKFIKLKETALENEDYSINK